IDVVQVDRKVFLLLGYIRRWPPIGGQLFRNAWSKVHGVAQRRRLKRDRYTVCEIRWIRTGNGRKGRKTRSTDGRKRHRTGSCGEVGQDPGGRFHEIRKVHKAVDAGQNDADGRESRPEYVIAHVIHVGAEANEMLSTDPGHGI